VLNGNKIFITNGNVADIICVVAVTDPDSRPKGISTLIFETDTPGFQAGKPMKKLGNRCSPTVELAFDNCKVPKENLLGTRDRSLIETIEFFSFERVTVAVACAAVTEAAMDACIDYAKSRRQFGVPIASFQGIQEMIAEMATDIYATRCMVVDLLTMMQNGQYDVDNVDKASMVKAFASESVNRHTSNAIQIFGGAGYTMDYPIERYYRDARVWSIGGGTTQIQRRLIARSLLK
jgi:acyl-CoA dehydrogenase